jgi:RND family efflux transporter MFP subunit
MFKKRNVILNSLLVLVLLVGGFFGYRTLYPAAAPVSVRTATATIQDVTQSVSASGAVQTATDIGLTFGGTGIVRVLKVKVGDQVRAGQLLAAIDDRSYKLALLQAEQSQANAINAVTNANAALAKLTAGPSDATKALQAKQLDAAQTTIDNANTAYTNAQAATKSTDAQLALNAITYQNSVDRTRFDFEKKCNAIGGLGDTNTVGVDCSTAENSRIAWQSWQDSVQSQKLSLIKDTTTHNNAATSEENARRAILAAQDALSTLKAQQAVTNAGAIQSDVDAAKATITSAQRAKDITDVQLSQAQFNYDNTKIIAPISGTVAAVASQIGVNAANTTAGSNGAAGYIILTDLSGLQVKASFAEADIANLQVGQAASFTFDALSGVTATGSVASIAPLANTSAGGSTVTSYTVLFTLDGNPDGVKPGMTAQVSVVTDQVTGVIAIPSTALTQRGQNYTVTLKPTKVGGVGKRVTVTVGLKGDSTSEITSGLKEGDLVVLRSTTSSSASSGFPAGGIPGAGFGAAVPAAGGGGGRASRGSGG